MHQGNLKKGMEAFKHSGKASGYTYTHAYIHVADRAGKS